ncbi:MAG TPA: hypothetical protein EYN74_04460 [Nitrospirales bacterium]|nr:hypothetical protein [Nitrospirales bacterium]
MFLIPGGNFAKTVLGLLPHLEAKGIHSSLLAWNGGARFLRSQSTSFQCFRDYFQVPTRPGWEDYRRFRRLWPKVRKLLRERPLLYQGVSLRPLLEEKLRHLCWRRWPDVVHAISVIQTILRAERPAVVVSGFDAAWLDMIFIRLAEAQGKACSLSALMGTFDYSWLPPFKARWLAAQGARTRDLYLQQGVSPDRIQVVGQPRYDNVHRVGDTPDRETFGIFPRQRVLVYATEPGNFISSRREKEVHEEALIRFFHGREEYFLLILLHPSDPGVVANCLLKKYRAKNIRVLPGGNPYGLMALCDVWVTAYSTTASEALIYEKPVLLMNFFGRHYLSELVERELAVYVYRSDELAPRIEEALRFKASSDFRERARTYVEWEFHYLDGQSGQRLAQMIAEKAGHVAKS